jgi:hypothetical protein
MQGYLFSPPFARQRILNSQAQKANRNIAEANIFCPIIGAIWGGLWFL